MTRLPFFNKYPYTNFEQLNLDWLMNTVGSFESRVDAVETKVSELDTKVDTFDGRITQNTEDIAGIKTRLDNDEDEIDGLKTRMTAAESDIDNLETDVGTLGTDVDDLKTRMTAAESDIDDLETDVGTLTTRVDGIPDVEANPGGTVTGSLVTLKIGDTIYQITGGGGGQGTEVIANPTGAGVADLTKVSIAGVIYDIPETDISGLEARVSDLETDVGGHETRIDDLEADDTALTNRVTDLEGDVTDLKEVITSSEIDFTNYRDNCQLNQSYDIASGIILPAGTYIVEFDIYVSFNAATLATHPGYYQLWAGYLKEDGTRPGLVEEIVVTPNAQADFTHFETCCRVVESTGTATLSVRTHINGPYYAGTSNASYHLSVAAHAVRIK